MKKFVLFILTSCCIQLSYSQDNPAYAVRNIPDSIRSKAPIIIRTDNEQMIVKEPGKAVSKIHRVLTVMNENGKEGLYFVEHPDDFRSIEKIDLNLYDANGKFISHLKRKELEKFEDRDGTTLASDNKILVGAFSTDVYPVTVEIDYEVNYSGILEYPDFLVMLPDRYIMESSLSITTPADNKPRFKNYRTTIQPQVSSTPPTVSYTWTVRNSLPLVLEDGVASRDFPRIMISPTLFEMDHYRGDMSSWESFGKWQKELISQTNQLPADKAAFFRQLVSTATTEREKVAILYRYMQENCRYVSIQLGIGGWKPFPADFVNQKKYGDCKALSNFMQAMLNTVNIKSHYAIINAGYDEMPVDKDFPQSAFNHVILCVPLQKDTVWLECTSKTAQFGVLGNFTENRYAFLITDKGGALVATPRSKAEQNHFNSHTRIEMTESGNGTAKMHFTYTGDFADTYNTYLFDRDEQSRLRFLHNRIGLKQPDEMKIEKERNPYDNSGNITLDLIYEKIPAFSTGSKQFLNSRLYKFISSNLKPDEHRQSAYYFDFPCILYDTTVYVLPEGFSPESIPQQSTLSFRYGSYSSQYIWNAENRTVTGICQFRLAEHIIPPDQYMATAHFFSDVVKDQQQKIIIKKQAP